MPAYEMDQSWVIITPSLLSLQDKYQGAWIALRAEADGVSEVEEDERHIFNSPFETVKSENFSLRKVSMMSSTMPWRLPMDDIRAPNLAAKSLDLQTREVFNFLVSSVLFPATYAAFYRRVDQDIISFVRDNQQAQCPVVEWMVRCYATWYLAKRHNDEEKLNESRYIYGVLLQYFRWTLLGDEQKRTSDITFVIGILLAIYEVLDGSTPDGWLVHMRGAKELLRQRGAAGYYSGFGRTIMLACRGFFLGEAFVSGERCILEEADWVDMNAKAFEREEKAGRGSKLVTIVDQTYREIVRAPGLVARARTLLDSGPKQCQIEKVEAKMLCAQIQRSRGALRRLMRRLACLSGMDITVTEEGQIRHDKASSLYIDPQYVPLIARYNLRGVCAVEALLGQAYSMLDKRKTHSNTKNEGHTLARVTAQIRHYGTPKEGLEEPKDSNTMTPRSLDDLFLSLGAMTICTDDHT